MPVVTKIKIQKNKKRANLYLDNKFAFGLSLDKVMGLGLAVGQRLSEKELKKIFFYSQFEKLYFKTLNLLSYRPRSQKEIENYLAKAFIKAKHKIVLKLRKKLEKKIFAKLKKQKLINDYEFSRWWVNQRLSFKPKGQIALRSELISKGVDKEIIDQTLALVSEEKLARLVKKLVLKKLKLGNKLTDRKTKQKLLAYLARRGFSYSLIKKVIDEIESK